MNDYIPSGEPTPYIGPAERQQIAEVLGERANEVAAFKEHPNLTHSAGVRMALDREIARLRELRSVLVGQ